MCARASFGLKHQQQSCTISCLLMCRTPVIILSAHLGAEWEAASPQASSTSHFLTVGPDVLPFMHETARAAMQLGACSTASHRHLEASQGQIVTKCGLFGHIGTPGHDRNLVQQGRACNRPFSKKPAFPHTVS